MLCDESAKVDVSGVGVGASAAAAEDVVVVGGGDVGRWIGWIHFVVMLEYDVLSC